MFTEEDLDDYLGAAGLGPMGQEVTPEQKASLDGWLASTRPAEKPHAPSPAQGEKQALEQVRPEQAPPAAEPKGPTSQVTEEDSLDSYLTAQANEARANAAPAPSSDASYKQLVDAYQRGDKAAMARLNRANENAPGPTSVPRNLEAERAAYDARREEDGIRQTPEAEVAQRPNLRPYGMEAPPQASRDRWGEVARTLLGVFAGKDKWAKRAALAEGVGTMISSKPGEDVDKENYDRNLRAAQLSNADEVRRAALARSLNDPYKKLYAETTAQRVNWERDARDPNSQASKNARELLISSGIDPKAVEGKSAYELNQFKGIAASTGELDKQKKLIDYREGKKLEEEERDFAVWLRKQGITNATDKDLIRFRNEQARLLKSEEKADEVQRRGEIPGTVVENPDAWNVIKADETTWRKTTDSVDAYSALMDALDGMIDIRRQYGAELPGHAQALYDSLKTNAVGAYTKLGESGTLNGGEWERYSSMLPSLAPDRADAQGLLQGKDVKLEQLMGVKQASQRVIDSRLRSKGIRFVGAGAPQPKRKARPAASPKPVTVTKASDLDDL